MAEYMEYDWNTNKISLDSVKPAKYMNQNDKKNSVKLLKNMIYNSEDFDLKNNVAQDENILMKFLYARKFDLEETFVLVKNYYDYRRRNEEIFRNFSLSAFDIRKSLENGLPGVLKNKDRRGRCVLVLTGTNWDCTYPLLTIYRALLYSLEHLIEDVHNQSNGFVIIVDWTEFTFRQSTNLKPSTLRLMIEGLQDCFPAKFKGIHFIGQPWYVEAALAVIKPFLKDKIKERIFVHGNNLSKLHELVHKDILPADLGGEQPSYNPSSFLDTLEELESKKRKDSDKL